MLNNLWFNGAAKNEHLNSLDYDHKARLNNY